MEKDKFNATAYKNKYIAENYERINFNVHAGDKAIIKAHAEKFDGGSMNGFIKRAIKETMQRDMEKQ